VRGYNPATASFTGVIIIASSAARRPRRPSRRQSATVIVASDWAPIRLFEPLARRDPEALYGDLLPRLREADLRVVNCECALTRRTEAVWKSGAVFKGEPAHARALAAVPFEVACLANNHVLDYGVRGLAETLHTLAQNGIRTVGAGLTERQACAPLSLTVNGLRVHLVNFSEGEDLTAADGGPGVFGWDIPRVIADVRRRKQAGGVVIVIGHCGLEYVPYPPPYVVAAFRAIADAGADCVIGHHPHVPQGIEWRRGRPIFYSLGNFVFYQPAPLHYRKVGFCVELRLGPDRVRGVDLIPYRITEAGLRQLTAGEDRDFRRDLARISRPFRTRAGAARAWDAYLAHYGMAGFRAEVGGIMDRMQTEPQKAAAMFRNRVTTMQHAELWRDALTRMIDRPSRPPAREASRIVEAWLTRPAD
jgi:poly-gamma-glutamate synthesis protein (capsule biosynthesis protein)